MFPIRVLTGFLARLLLVFVPIILLWPAVDGPYGKILRNSGNALVGVGTEGRIWFSPTTEGNPRHDSRLVVVDREAGLERTTAFSSRKYGYMPAAFVLALVLATPIPWSRRWRALLWGLLAVHVYVAARLVFLPDAYGAVAVGDEDGLGGWWVKLLGRLYCGMDASTAGWMFAPAAIWALVTFRRGDWPGILQGSSGEKTTG